MAFLRVHQPSSQGKIDSARKTDELAHDPRPRDTRDPGVDLRLPHTNPRMPDPQVTKERHLESGSCCYTVQSRDNRLGQRAHAAVKTIPLPYPFLSTVRVERFSFIEVLPSPKSLTAGAR